MAYEYEKEKPFIFTDEGNRAFIKIRDNTFRLMKQSGAARCQEMMIGTGNSWSLLACIDRMVELNDIREITPPNVAGQDRVFVLLKSF